MFFGEPLCGALDVWLVLGLSADARNAQKFRQFGEILVAVIFYVLEKIHQCAPKRTGKMDADDVRCVTNAGDVSPRHKPTFYGSPAPYSKRNAPQLFDLAKLRGWGSGIRLAS